MQRMRTIALCAHNVSSENHDDPPTLSSRMPTSEVTIQKKIGGTQNQLRV